MQQKYQFDQNVFDQAARLTLRNQHHAIRDHAATGLHF